MLIVLTLFSGKDDRFDSKTLQIWKDAHANVV